MPYPSGIVKGIEDQSGVGARHFFGRLTCAIDGDLSIKAIC